MRVSDIIDYLIELERVGFTGAVTLNFYKGNLSHKVEKNIFVMLNESITAVGERRKR